jgi:hypothetical protein
LVGDREGAHFQTTYNGMQVLFSGRLILKGFSFFGNANIEGWLLQIDPDNLEFDVKMQTADIVGDRSATGIGAARCHAAGDRHHLRRDQ